MATRKFECYSGCGYISIRQYTIEVIDGLLGVCPSCGKEIEEEDFSEFDDKEIDRQALDLAHRLTAILAADTEDPAHTMTAQLTHDADKQRTLNRIRKEQT